jgi:hypothetical protein
MFENLPPKRAAHMRFGCKKRYAIAVVSLLDTIERIMPGTLLPHETEQIKEIKRNVIARAEKERDEEIRRADTTIPEADIGSTPECRTYNGK